jgi:hypothetical protein
MSRLIGTSTSSGRDNAAEVTDAGALKVDIGGAAISVTVDDGLSIPAHDYIAMTYTGTNLTGLQYRMGGAGGTIVGTRTMAYSGSNLISITKS